MPEWVLIFVSGLLGSTHCLGMCGGFAVAIGGGAASPSAALGRQLLYSAGRVATYSLAGAIAGFGGLWLAAKIPPLVNVQAVLALLAGAILVYEGLRAGGWWPARRRAAAGVPCLAGSFLAPLLRAPGPAGPLVAGMATAFLPCGLLYAFLALASSTGSLWGGGLVMLSFALGTVPLMVAVGCLGPALLATARGQAWRRGLFRLAAVAVVAVGAMSVARGVSFFAWPGRSTPPACPACATAQLADRALNRAELAPPPGPPESALPTATAAR